MFEAKLRRKKEVVLIPLVPRKPSVEVKKKKSKNKLKKRPAALILQPQSQRSPSRPGTPTSQNSDTQTQRQPNRLRKRSRSFARSSPESVQQSLPVQTPATPPPPAQVQAATVKDRDRDKAPEAVFHRMAARTNLGPPPSPSNGKRFDSTSALGRRSPDKIMLRPSQAGPSTPPRRARSPPQDWEVIEIDG